MQILRMWCWRISCTLLVIVTLAGCPKKTPSTSETSLESSGSVSGLGEKNLSGGMPSDAGSRLDERMQGRGEGGPLRDVLFAFDSYDLSSEARATLQNNAGCLRSN